MRLVPRLTVVRLVRKTFRALTLPRERSKKGRVTWNLFGPRVLLSIQAKIVQELHHLAEN